jgi:small subunit ribosomal protein S5
MADREENDDVPDESDRPNADEIDSADDAEEQLAMGDVPRINLPDGLRKVAETRGDEWVPRTRLGRLVKAGKISSMSQALSSGIPLREPEIVDILLPDLHDEVIDVNMVQRMTDSGRRVRFSITTVIGNKDGFVGIGMAKGREVGPTIRRAIDNAKLNMLEIRRGCGSWECGCGTPHTVPFRIDGKCASAEVSIKPAPRGVGLAVGEIARKVLELAGVRDAWGFARGQTRTTVNACKATFDALEKLTTMRINPNTARRVTLVAGPRGGAAHTHTPPPPEPKAPPAEEPATAREPAQEEPPAAATNGGASS